MNKGVPPHWQHELATWLAQQDSEQELARKVWSAACFTAWQRCEDGSFAPDHPERGMLLYWIIANRAIRRALQVETGHGFNCAVMARAALDAGATIQIDTVDARATTEQQPWVMHDNGSERTLQISVAEVFAQHFAEFSQVIHHHTGVTHKRLYSLLKEGAHYGLIVLSARATPYELLRDLCYCIPMLEDDGAIVLDGFSPTQPRGLGPVMLLPHLRRLFVDVSVYDSAGRVWPVQGMDRQRVIVASGHRFPEWRLHKSQLLFWKICSWFMMRTYRSTYHFPLKPDVD